jgi:hypothetical protein
VIGRTYLLSGEPVVVVARWGLPDDRHADHLLHPPVDGAASAYLVVPATPRLSPVVVHRDSRRAPRNVLVEFADGRRLVRPFRGLRRP